MKARRRGALTVLLLALALWLLPQAGAFAAGPQGIYAKSWIVVDARSGDVLASHAAERHLPIASTTKLMTAYVAMRSCRWTRSSALPPTRRSTASL